MASMEDHKWIIIIDVGGYFAQPVIDLQNAFPDCAKWIVGIIEDTTFGHNRYIKCVRKIRVPVFSVARSSLKEIEARFVGQDAVKAMDTVLRELGVLMSGRHALVIGYGMIGKNIALALKNSHLVVSVYDQYDFRNLAAYIDGYNIHKKRELIKSADIIFLATGDPSGALSYENIEFKAVLRDYNSIFQRLRQLTNSTPIRLEQVDIFYKVRKGRLKLRKEYGEQPELIYYLRQNKAKPKRSKYYRFLVLNLKATNTWGKSAAGKPLCVMLWPP